MAYTGINRLIAVFSDPIPGKTTNGLARGMLSSRDLSDLGGNGRIHGDVKKVGSPDSPVWRRVRLFARRDGRLVREQWSDPVTGAYSFEYVNPSLEYTLVAYDHTGVYQAVISDNPTIDPMP